MKDTFLDIFRIIGFSEGISFLLLLGIAMPLKYFFSFPIVVTIVGAIHGGLFVIYILAVIISKFKYRWSIPKAFLAAIASIIPFGPFIFDAKLLKN